MKTKIIFPLLAALVIFGTCKKDSDDNNDSSIWGSTKTITVAGRILDENGNAVSGAAVTAGSASATTDNIGVFYLANADVFENLGYVKVEKQGYFPGSRSFVPKEGTNTVNIIMLEKTIAGTVLASTGGTVSTEGVDIAFSGGSFVRNNTPYAGQVNVALKYINPEGQTFAEEMPGNLIAVQDGNGTGLTSYGMIAVELTDNSGSEVKIADGQTAQITFPLSSSLQNTAPAEIDLWSFDETNGYWMREGKATRQNGVYTASVSHFSFWNCDIPITFVILKGYVIYSNGNGVQGAKVRITSNAYGSATDYTSSTGYFGGYVPNGEILNITIEVSCGSSGYQTVYASQIGPFSSATTLPSVTISNPSSATVITGSVVDCDNNVIPGGYVVADGQAYFLNNGQFELLACGTTASITPYASPVWAAGQTQNITLPGGDYDAGALRACDSGINTGTVTDSEGNVYRTVEIGNQWWMAENLRVNAGIAQVSDSIQWANIESSGSQTPAWCYHQNNPANDTTYGKLYNWYAVNTGNLCPDGWHIPTDAEWQQLVDFLGGDAVAGGAMKSAVGWDSPNTGATNTSGFTGLPGGYRNSPGNFEDVGTHGYFWSTTEAGSGAWLRYLRYNESKVLHYSRSKARGYSCRCVRD